MPQLCGMILQEPPTSPRELRPELPDGLQAVMLRCLEKKREARFANVADLAAALAPFGTPNAARSAERVSRVLSAAGISSRQLDIPTEALGTSSAWGTTQRQRNSHRTLWIALGAAGAALALAVALFLRHSAHPTAEPTGPTPPSAPATPAAPTALTVTPPAVPAAPVAVSATVSAAPPEPAGASEAPPKTSTQGARQRPTKSSTAKTATAKPSAAPPPAARPAIDPLEGRR
jgi:serine/threonine-protein kinase